VVSVYTTRFSIQKFCVLISRCIYECRLWISEQTTMISQYNSSRLIFVTEMESVYCAVRTAFNYKSGYS